MAPRDVDTKLAGTRNATPELIEYVRERDPALWVRMFQIGLDTYRRELVANGNRAAITKRNLEEGKAI